MSEKQEITKKRNYKQDFVQIMTAVKRMILYSLKVSPYNTIGILLVIFVTAIYPFVNSWINSRVIDELVALIGTHGSTSVVFKYTAISLSLLLLRNILTSLEGFVELRLYFDISREFNKDVTTKFANLDIEYHENPETSNLLQKVAENSGHRPQEFISSIFWSLRPIISIISAISILATFSPVLILILAITTAPAFINNIFFGRRKWGIWDAKGELKRDYFRSKSHITSEHSLMELRIFKTRKYLLNRIFDLFYNFQKEEIAIENKRAFVDIALGIVSVIGFGFTYFVTILATLAQKITIGQLNFYLATSREFSSSLDTLFRRSARAYEHGLYVVDIFKFLDMKEKVTSGQICLADKTLPPTIKFENVDFTYPGGDKKALDQLNLTIEPGDHIAIVGENGAGKTTLIKCLMRFYDINNGKITVDGHNLSDLDLENWYDLVGTLFQDFNRYHFDVKTNIGMGNTAKINDEEAIKTAAKNSGASAFIDGYEQKYNQVLSKAFEGGIEPSVGQWQKIALARAFFKDAPVLILDEPTSAIDPKAEAEIFENLFEFAKNKTVIIISHRFSTVRNAKRIIVLEKGKIAEQGSHSELMQIEDGKYKKAFEIQRKGYA